MRLESGVAVIEKTVGETPLAALERFRREHSIGTNVPLAYAGRLDPMASGALLILIGETCKRQTEFHGLDKEYVVEVLFGVASDTGDVLGIVRASKDREPTTREVTQILSSIVGTVTFPYPHFSAKTVRGKPLHMWTLEGRLDEITIPMNTSKIYSLRLEGMRTVLATELLQSIHAKIDTIPEVTDARKTLGKNFRRDEVHASWDHIAQESARAVYTVATIR